MERFPPNLFKIRIKQIYFKIKHVKCMNHQQMAEGEAGKFSNKRREQLNMDSQITT